MAKVGQKSNKYMRKNYGALNSSKYGKYLPNTRKGNTNWFMKCLCTCNMWKRLYQKPITGMQKHEVFTKIVYFEVSIEELLLLVVEREFDLEGKWKQGGEAAPWLENDDKENWL